MKLLFIKPLAHYLCCYGTTYHVTQEAALESLSDPHGSSVGEGPPRAPTPLSSGPGTCPAWLLQASVGTSQHQGPGHSCLVSPVRQALGSAL